MKTLHNAKLGPLILVYDIQPQDPLKRGYEAAIIDLDNTVIA